MINGINDNDCLRRILGRRRLDRVLYAVLRRQLHLRALPPALLRRRLRWFGPAALRPTGEIISEVINPAPPEHLLKKRGGLLKTWETTPREDLARLSGPADYGLRP